jgi:hypothetical protein
MKRRSPWGLITCTLVASILTATSFAQRTELVKQLTADTGWISNGHDLFWTTNGGSEWKNIAPPQLAADKEISAVFFLDTSRGWAVLSNWRSDRGTAAFSLASTDDAGTNWSWHPISLPGWENLPEGLQLNISQEDVAVYFWDALHGIVALGGDLALTANGGKTWHKTNGPGFGPLLFTTRNDGWVRGESARLDYHGKLFVTHDGSKSWQQVVLPGPKPEQANATYGLPIFTDQEHGFLTIQYSGPGIQSVALFSSTDAGRTWKKDNVLSSDSHTTYTPVNSEWRAVTLANHKVSIGLPLTTSLPSSGGAVDEAITNVYHSSFVDSSHGWVLAGTSGGTVQIFSTSDSGATWTNITPSPMKLAPSKPVIRTGPTIWKKPQGKLAPASPPSDVSIHLGFDKSPVLTIDQMQAWWDASPYFDTNVYLPGSANKTVDANLNASWTSAIQTQGWGIIPTWFGAQPPTACLTGTKPGSCTTYFSTVISGNASTAFTQGVNEANAAINSLTAPGPTGVNLSGTIIYKNIENYVTGTTGDSAAVKAFLSGWSTTLHARTPLAYLAGVYGNPAPASTDFAKVTPPLDDGWIASSNKKASTWGLWTLGGTTDTTLWAKDQRVHQYWIDHNETHGGQGPFKIDSDIEDATIINNQGVKTYTYTNWTSVASPYTDSNGRSAIWFSDVSTPLSSPAPGSDNITGSYLSAQAVPDGHNDLSSGFYYTLFGSMTQNINYPSIPDPITTTFGMNNLGTILGVSYNCQNPTCDQNPIQVYWTWKAGSFSALGTPGGLFLDGNCNAGSGQCGGINDAGQIANTICTDGTCVYDSGYLDQNGKYTLLNYPGASSSSAVSINGQGQVVGSYQNGTGGTFGFIWSAADGYETFSIPGASYTIPLKINNNGQVLVCASPARGCYLYYNGAFALVPLPNPPPQWIYYLSSINDFADVVGASYYGYGATTEDGLIGTTQR